VTLSIDRPYAVTAERLSPVEITHGEEDFFQASAVNRAQFPVDVTSRWRSTNLRQFTSPPSGPPGTFAPGNQTPTPVESRQIPPRRDDPAFSSISFRDRDHAVPLHRARNPIQYRVDLDILAASMVIDYPLTLSGLPIKAVWQDSPLPSPVPAVDATRCSAPSQVSVVIPGGSTPVDGAAREPEPRQFAFVLGDVTDEPVAFTGTISDDYGTIYPVESSPEGRAEVKAAFTGPFGNLAAVALDPALAPLSVRFLFDRVGPVLAATRFLSAPGPAVAGVVAGPATGPVPGARVTFTSPLRTQAVETVADGTFRIATTAQDWSGSGPILEVLLPQHPEIQWASDVVTVDLDRATVERGDPVTVSAEVATSDRTRVELSGRVLLRDEANRATMPASGAALRLRSSTGAIVARGRSGADGRYATKAPPGVYWMEVTPPRRISVRPIPPTAIYLGADRPGVDVHLRVPRPQTLDLGDTIRVVAPADGLRVALVAGDEIVDTRALSRKALDLDRSELSTAGITAVAFIANGGSSGLAPLPAPSPDLTIEPTAATTRN
jgi:hypothetical protein